jgi:hypothetical protein
MKLVEKFCTPLRKLRLHDVKLTGVCREALFMLSTRSIPIILYVKTFITYVRFENLTAVTRRARVSWVVTLCSSETARHFREHIASIFRVGNEMFLQNVGFFLNYTVLQTQKIVPFIYNIMLYYEVLTVTDKGNYISVLLSAVTAYMSI